MCVESNDQRQTCKFVRNIVLVLQLCNAGNSFPDVQQRPKTYVRVLFPSPFHQVQIRPWSLADADFVMDASQVLDPRKTIFVGGVPRPLRAVELALIMDRLYGGVCYSGIDVDPELKYPKG